MRISAIDDEGLDFDNGNKIEFGHTQDCCEWNYADFSQLPDEAKTVDFDEELEFEKVEHGFRFRSAGTQWFFVPCYSEQNGYYTNKLDIYYVKKVCDVEAELTYRKDY